MQKQLSTYRQVDTLGKSQIDLVLKVYDGALQALMSARTAYVEQDWDRGYKQLERARRFVTHLYTTLDMEKGGDVAASLSQLYVFTLNQINVVQGTKDITIIDNLLKVVGNVRDGWNQLKQSEAVQSGTAPREQTTGTITVTG